MNSKAGSNNFLMIVLLNQNGLKLKGKNLRPEHLVMNG